MTIKQEKMLLDEFAIAAMGAIIGSENQIKSVIKTNPHCKDYGSVIANYAYSLAKRMMMERENHEH